MGVHKRMLGKAMKAAGLRRISPEMAKQFSVPEKLAAALGGYFSFYGVCAVLFSFLAFYPFCLKAYRAWNPLPVVTDLETVSQLEREASVDVVISVDFEKAVKVTNWKGCFFMVGVDGFEKEIFFFRKGSYFEGEGRDKPIRVTGRAAKKGKLGWGIPGMKSRDERTLAEAGLVLPEHAEILYEFDGDDHRVWEKYGLALLGLGAGFVIWNFSSRAFRAVRILGSPRLLAEALNERLGLEDDA